MTSPRPRWTGEDGFTLVELIVAMGITLILIFAALLAFDNFNSGVASSSRRTEAEDTARRSVSRIVSVLRDAGAPPPASGAQPETVISAGGNDLVFRTTAWPGESATGASGTHVARICVDGATGKLWFDGLRAGTVGSPSPGGACPSTSPGWTHVELASGVVNSAAEPVFRYGSGSPVRAVGISLRLEGGTAARTRPLALHSGSAMRGALAPRVTPGDITVGPCQSGRALLTLNASGGGETLRGVTLSASGAITAGGNSILVTATSASTEVAVTVTNALGLQTLLFKEVSCP